MPTLQQISVGNQSSVIPNKPPPPSHPPPPPPPPPPRNSSQLLVSPNLIGALTANSNGPNSSSLLNNGSSMSSLNSAGRCSITQSLGPTSVVPVCHNSRSFMKHGDTCSSRSSVSSHSSSLQHHHYVGGHNIVGGISNPGFLAVNNGSCIHQASIGCGCMGSSTAPPHVHPNSSGLSDTESCNMSFNQDNRILNQIPCCASNTGHHHSFNVVTKCQASANGTQNINLRSNNNNGLHDTSPTTTTISRNALFCNNSGGCAEGVNSVASINGTLGGYVSELATTKNHCVGQCAHHHHHHHHHNSVNNNNNMHNVQLSSSSSLTSLQHVVSNNNNSNSNNNVNNNNFSRCVSNTSSLSGTGTDAQMMMMQRPNMMNHHCNHVHRPNPNCCHHSVGCCGGHVPTIVQQQQQQQQQQHSQLRDCGKCSHLHGIGACHMTHYNCNSNMLIGGTVSAGKDYALSGIHHHYTAQEMGIDGSSSVLLQHNNNDSLTSTVHTHNLSNSSTTTHTSNVAVKHQSQFHRPGVLSKDGRSNSSQQYDQYGPSSAASTSSATASLSSYQTPAGYDDLINLYPASKLHQPLPPTPTTTINNRSQFGRPQSPGQIFKNRGGVGIGAGNLGPSSGAFNLPNMHINGNNNNTPTNGNNGFSAGSNQFQMQQQFNGTQLPPLPPKPVSPNASSCSTQITTVRTSPSLQNHPITRLTSQAGVQIPLPNTDVPPPLPPVNSRPQPLVNSLLTRIPPPIANTHTTNSTTTNTINTTVNDNDNFQSNPIPNFINLNLNIQNNGSASEMERKTEALTRQVELELEQQKKAGEPYGVCPKCNNKVLPSQEACKAMNQIFHASCFICCECGRTLSDKKFYPVGDKVYCEEDFRYTGHMQSLEKCVACSQPIFDMILHAMQKSYHPKCFKCSVCGKCLDGVPFVNDQEDRVYCQQDFYSKYSRKCARCGKTISPIDDTGETVRVVSRNKDYHIDCFSCEDCGLQLTDEEPSQSFPIDNHLLCQKCHIERRGRMQATLSLA